MASASTWQEVGDRVFVRRYRFYDQSIVAVVGDEGVTIVDTRTTSVQAREILADLATLTPLPVAAVVNTHLHMDHTFGNSTFRPAPIWGHVRCRDGLVATFERQRASTAADEPDLAADLADVVCDPPDRVFEETAVIDAGGRRIELRYLGRAHTDNDIVVLVPDAGVLAAGDILENGAPPWFGDGFPLDWPETASRLLELVRGPVVAGHGEPADQTFVEDSLVAIQAVADLGRAVHRGDRSLDDAIAGGPYERFRPGASREPIERALAQLRGELD
jgi:glyoxylase-like metal-dependent hydrolase (beta-lactamase superfamily II)